MPRKRKRPIEVLSPEEVEALIQAASNRAPSGIRNRALIAILYYAGVRLSEALALLPRDVDLERGGADLPIHVRLVGLERGPAISATGGTRRGEQRDDQQQQDGPSHGTELTRSGACSVRRSRRAPRAILVQSSSAERTWSSAAWAQRPTTRAKPGFRRSPGSRTCETRWKARSSNPRA